MSINDDDDSSSSSSSNSAVYYVTIFVFGLISVIMYVILSRPTIQQQQQYRAGITGTAIQQQQQQQVGTISTGPITTNQRLGGTNRTDSTNTNNNNSSSSKVTSYEKANRVPVHVSATSAKITIMNGSNILSDGIVAFRHTTAAAADEQQQQNQHQQQQQLPLKLDDGTAGDNEKQVQVQQQLQQQQLVTTTTTTSNDSSSTINRRKELARILSRLLDESINGGVTISTPPVKGSTVIVSVPVQDCSCPKLRRILYILGTSYNLFTIIVLNTPEQFINEQRTIVINTLRGINTTTTTTSTTSNENVTKDIADDNDDDTTTTSTTNSTKTEYTDFILPNTVLPSHRIIACTSITGRVAFARQLDRVELIIDYDIEVKQFLSRFGHKVLIINPSNTTTTTTSSNVVSLTTSRLGSVLL